MLTFCRRCLQRQTISQSTIKSRNYGRQFVQASRNVLNTRTFATNYIHSNSIPTRQNVLLTRTLANKNFQTGNVQTREKILLRRTFAMKNSQIGNIQIGKNIIMSRTLAMNNGRNENIQLGKNILFMRIVAKKYGRNENIHTGKNNLLTRTFVTHVLYNQRQNLQTRKTRLKTNVNQREKENVDEKACLAYCTSESYHLDQLRQYFIKDSHTYTLGALPKDASDVLYVKKQTTNNENEKELEEIFLFRRLGAFVCWNVNENEVEKLRHVLKEYEMEPYKEEDILEEFELLNFESTAERQTCMLEGDIFINNQSTEETQVLEKLAFSNALALSVRLNMWETALDKFSLSLRHIPERMKEGHKVKISRKEILQKIGELLTLRHQINLYSDLLITPDFFWERDDLEAIYAKTCKYLEVGKRTNVINEKLELCSELVEMIRSHLNDEHSHRLEWMIIVLITIEVVFEIAHWTERVLRNT